MCSSVLDEADLLLSFGHEADVAFIASKLPRGVQAMLVSATCRCVLLPLTTPHRAHARPRYPACLQIIGWRRRFIGRAEQS